VYQRSGRIEVPLPGSNRRGDQALFRRDTVEHFVRRQRIGPSLFDKLVDVVGRAIKRAETQGLVAGVRQIVPGTCGDDDGIQGNRLKVIGRFL
jgi:hypothetical protein